MTTDNKDVAGAKREDLSAHYGYGYARRSDRTYACVGSSGDKT
jgi:hypothetical protein